MVVIAKPAGSYASTYCLHSNLFSRIRALPTNTKDAGVHLNHDCPLQQNDPSPDPSLTSQLPQPQLRDAPTNRPVGGRHHEMPLTAGIQAIEEQLPRASAYGSLGPDLRQSDQPWAVEHGPMRITRLLGCCPQNPGPCLARLTSGVFRTQAWDAIYQPQFAAHLGEELGLDNASLCVGWTIERPKGLSREDNTMATVRQRWAHNKHHSHLCSSLAQIRSRAWSSSLPTACPVRSHCYKDDHRKRETK